jgi:HD superfamily phosphohydrolase
MAHLVYPGANHTRFDHSLGVYHIASLMVDELLPGKEHEERKNIIRYAALLHDVGHGPFSHVSEAVLNNFFQSEYEEKVHEQITLKLIERDSELKAILSPDEIKMTIGLLSGKKFDFSIMKEIVSGPLDSDKMDYLLRDSYFCGVKYGIFDFHRLINTLEFYNEGKDMHIAVKFDGMNSLEQFVLAKYYMTRQVYRHKVRILSDAMIVRGLELGVEEDEIPFLVRLFKFQATDDYLENYLDFYDDKILNDILFSEKKGYAFEMFNRLYRRKLLKRIFSEKLSDIPVDSLMSYNQILWMTV